VGRTVSSVSSALRPPVRETVAMRTRMLWAAALLAAVGVSGGSRSEVVPDGPEPEEPPPLGQSLEYSVADRLKPPRQQLAKMADEREETVRLHREKARTEPETVELLPNLCPPEGAPVFRKATFSAPAGLSLPPYLTPGQKDAAVALHLAS